MDKIERLLTDYVTFPEKYTTKGTAKQIRQQIGRELLQDRYLYNHSSGDNFVSEKGIREVCKLEEE